MAEVVNSRFDCVKVSCDSDDATVYRVKLTTSDEADEWLKAYETATQTHWVVDRTYPQLCKLTYRKNYVCHHSAIRRVQPGAQDGTTGLRNERGKSKNCGCPARLVMKIYLQSSREDYAKVCTLHFAFLFAQ